MAFTKVQKWCEMRKQNWKLSWELLSVNEENALEFGRVPEPAGQNLGTGSVPVRRGEKGN